MRLSIFSLGFTSYRKQWGCLSRSQNLYGLRSKWGSQTCFIWVVHLFLCQIRITLYRPCSLLFDTIFTTAHCLTFSPFHLFMFCAAPELGSLRPSGRLVSRPLTHTCNEDLEDTYPRNSNLRDEANNHHASPSRKGNMPLCAPIHVARYWVLSQSCSPGFKSRLCP